MKSIVAEVITIGDEILYGQITDTNTQWISAEIDKVGIKTIRKTSIGDQESQILGILEEGFSRADILLMTGGLGPTKDDITKKTIAKYFNDTLEINKDAEAFVKDFFEKRGRPFTEINRQQAALPTKCTYLPNITGTAPGMWFEHNGKILVSMPGVPVEMKYLIEHEVIPRLKAFFELPVIEHHIISTIGIGESFLAETIEEWEDQLPEHIRLAYLPSFSQVRLRLTGFGDDRKIIQEQIKIEAEKVKPLIASYIFSESNQTIAEAVGELLKSKNATLGVAESCTGGNIAHMITLIPGSSAFFLGGVVSYSNDAKMNVLKVKQETLTNFGAVSEQTVKQMAEGVRITMRSTYGIATSGIAGPDGGTADKPVGTVWIAVSDGKTTEARLLKLGKQREVNIEYSSVAALNLLRRFIN
ncbi:competence/damage-inducible protein A [Lacihabitans lacunae]|uniref:CinA-like protein n=1 Tax=Lacihabitans lacunae TaxID=1028214 RepID=A0ABV7YR77_9BACT